MIMLDASALFFDSVITTLITPTNHDIYEKRLTDDSQYAGFKRLPCHIYFYYLMFGPDGYPEIRQYDYDSPTGIDYEDVPTIMGDLANNARNNSNNPPPTHFDFASLKWNRISYIAFVMDSARWVLWKRLSDPSRAGIVFDPKKQTGVSISDNHSFFDALDVTVPIRNSSGGVDHRSGIYFVNHMKADDAGADLGTSNINFAFEMYFDVAMAGSQLPTVFIIDPGGTNMGPPAPPP
jgi:hypothetical protein